MKLDIYPLKLYFSRISTLVLALPALALNLFVWLWLGWSIPGGQEEVYLHYNVLFGVDKIGQSWQVFYLPLVGLFIFIVNLFLGWFLYKREKFMAQLLNFFSLLCQIFLVIGAALLIFLNT